MRALLILPGIVFLAGEATGQARFGRVRQLTPPQGGRTVAAADMNGDNLDDLLLTGGTTRLWLQTPDGRFTDSGTSFPGVFGDSTLLFDVELDGDMDVAIARQAVCPSDGPTCSGGQSQLYVNDGNGDLTDETHRLPTPNGNGITLAMAAGDVTGDGLPDLVVGHQEHCWDDGCCTSGCVGGYAVVWRQFGSGDFGGGLPINLGMNIMNAGIVRLGDVDADGDLDLYLGGGNSFTDPGDLHRLFLGSGTGAFNEMPGLLPPPPISGFQGVHDTVLVDVEGDGDMDIVTSFRLNTSGEPRVYINDGLGGPFTWDPARLDGSGVYSFLVTDFQSDGLPDLVLGQAHATELRTNDGAGYFVASGPLPDAPGRFAASYAAPDVGGDGDADLALVSSRTHLFLGDDTGAFGPAPGTLPWAIGSGPLALFDADGDLDLDVAMVRGFGGYLFENDGSGQLDSIESGDWTASQGGSGVVNLAAEDFDGDGDPDLIGSRGHVYGNANGEFGLERILTRGPGGANEDGYVVASDFDRDGALDLAFASFPSIGIQRNLGGLAFAFVTPQVLPNATAGVLAAGDVDGDGTPDLLGSGIDATTQLFLGRPNGFVDASGAMPAGSSPLYTTVSSYALGDVDLDGDLDLLVGTTSQSTDPSNLLYSNTGLGFEDLTTTHLPPHVDRTRAVALEDFDADGDLDAFWTNDLVPARYLDNDGSGLFTDTSQALPDTRPGDGFVVGDLDGDDDLDLVLRRAPLDVVVNQRRQLAWDTFPRIGQELGLELWGTPGAAWKLAFSPGRGRFLPALGPLFLEPTTLQLVGRGTLDGEGYARTTTLIPPEPGLVGLVLFGQALIGAPLEVSNLEIVRVTGF